MGSPSLPAGACPAGVPFLLSKAGGGGPSGAGGFVSPGCGGCAGNRFALRAGGDAPVRVTLHADGFAVSDAGCGMTKEQIARAFEPFYKADKSRARAQGGAGLGLTLCRKIARLHGGDLSIVSEPGRGTTVVYHFDTTR